MGGWFCYPLEDLQHTPAASGVLVESLICFVAFYRNKKNRKYFNEVILENVKKDI